MKSLRGISKRMLSVKKLDVEGGGDERRNTGANGRRRQQLPRAGAGRRQPSGPGAGPPADPDKFVDDICRRLRSNDPSIAQLNVYQCELGDDRIEQIADAIASSSRVATLDVGRNNLTVVGASALAAGLRANESIHTAWLRENAIGQLGVEAISDMLESNQSLTGLSLGRNGIDHDGSAALAAALKTNQVLRTLWLYGNEVGDLGVEFISEALRENNTLVELYLGGNQVTEQGAESLCNVLANDNDTLVKLELFKNRVSDQGALMFAELLGKTSALRDLNLRANDITYDGAAELVRALTYNESLEQLDLRDNLLNEEEQEAIIEEAAALPRSVVVLVKSSQRPCPAAAPHPRHKPVGQHHSQDTGGPAGRKISPAPHGTFPPIDGKDEVIAFDSNVDNVGDQLQEATDAAPSHRPSRHNDDMVSYKDRALATSAPTGTLAVDGRDHGVVPKHTAHLNSVELDTICQALEENDGSIVELDLADRGLGDTGIDALSGPICQSHTVRILNLKNNNMTYDGVSTLASYMRSTDEGDGNGEPSPFLVVLEELNISWNDILDRGIVSLSMSLREALELRRLFINNAALADEATAALSDMLKCIQIEQLHLRHNSVGSDGAALLSEALNDDASMAALLLGWNDIGVTGTEFICDSLRRNQTLRLLDLDGNDLGGDGAAAVSLALRDNTSISSIWLASNNIGDLGIDSLSDSLTFNSTLLTLDLENNGITAEGGALLAVALRHNSTLENLWLGSNSIGDEGVECISDALSANTAIRELSLRFNGITSEGASMIASSLRDICHLESLWLGGNPINDSGVLSLADSLCVNSSLRLLCLEGTGITDDGASNVYAALEENGTIATILLGCNKIGDKGVLAMICHALKANRLSMEWETSEKDSLYYIKQNEHEKEIRLPENLFF